MSQSRVKQDADGNVVVQIRPHQRRGLNDAQIAQLVHDRLGIPVVHHAFKDDFVNLLVAASQFSGKEIEQAIKQLEADIDDLLAQAFRFVFKLVSFDSRLCEYHIDLKCFNLSQSGVADAARMVNHTCRAMPYGSKIIASPSGSGVNVKDSGLMTELAKRVMHTLPTSCLVLASRAA